MTKPTREEVEALCKAVNELDVIENPATSLIIVKQHFRALSDAYLAQEEELNAIKSALRGESLIKNNYYEQIVQLRAENQALKAEREKDIQDAINEYRGDLRS